MAIYTTNAKSGPYVGDGSQTTFPFDFPVTDAESVKVYLNGALVESGVSVGKGEVTFGTPPSSGSTVTILRRVAITQETDIQNNTAFYPEIIETALDKLTMICQQFDEELDRCISVPVGGDDATPAALLEQIFTASKATAEAVEATAEAVGRAEAIADEIAGGAEKVEAALKASAGIPIGAVFPFPASVPPEGAYLLNGQTIYGCNELYPKFWEWVTTSNVRSIDSETYEAELADTGVCGGFVINSAMGSVRLPKWKYQAPLGDTLPVRGNGMVVGLTNGTNNGGLTAGTVNNAAGGLFVASPNYGSAVSSNDVATSRFNGSLGVTTDPDKSGIVAENNALTDHFVWCIQVYNAATALSEQESAQLASQMQMKAQTDLANVTANIDFIIKHEEAADGSWWYDLYRSGKVVQSVNLVAPSTTWALITVTLPIEMADNKYSVQRTFTTTTSATSVNLNRLGIYERSETAITCSTNSGLIPDNLLIIGKAATE